MEIKMDSYHPTLTLSNEDLVIEVDYSLAIILGCWPASKRY